MAVWKSLRTILNWETRKEEIEVEYTGGDLKIGFNAKYVTDILTSMSQDKIDFELNDHLSPGLIRPHNDMSYVRCDAYENLMIFEKLRLVNFRNYRDVVVPSLLE